MKHKLRAALALLVCALFWTGSASAGPTGNLDQRTAMDVFDLFERLVDDGKTLLMVTHDKELARRVPRVVEIVDGRITRDEFVGEVAWTGY